MTAGVGAVGVGSAGGEGGVWIAGEGDLVKLIGAWVEIPLAVSVGCTAASTAATVGAARTGMGAAIVSGMTVVGSGRAGADSAAGSGTGDDCTAASVSFSEALTGITGTGIVGATSRAGAASVDIRSETAFD